LPGALSRGKRPKVLAVRRLSRVGGFCDEKGGVRAVPRRRLHAVDALADGELGHAGADRNHRAGEVVAQSQGKARRAQERKQPAAVAGGAAHVDRIDRGGLDGDLDLVRGGLLARNLANFELAAGFGAEAQGYGPRGDVRPGDASR
jgi:hypothetical protein